jgi:predicted nucleic acid-binding protein
MYLVDTNVISAAAPSISKLRREGATRKSADLTAWLETVLHLYGDRVLAFDVPTARIAGMMADRARGQGHAPGLADIIVAATAQQHGLTVLSRSLRHIEPLGDNVLDPFARLPPAAT